MGYFKRPEETPWKELDGKSGTVRIGESKISCVDYHKEILVIDFGDFACIVAERDMKTKEE